jgi:hypothetical protein
LQAARESDCCPRLPKSFSGEPQAKSESPSGAARKIQTEALSFLELLIDREGSRFFDDAPSGDLVLLGGKT